jgi:hypothetical protein
MKIGAFGITAGCILVFGSEWAPGFEPLALLLSVAFCLAGAVVVALFGGPKAVKPRRIP